VLQNIEGDDEVEASCPERKTRGVRPNEVTWNYPGRNVNVLANVPSWNTRKYPAPTANIENRTLGIE
jgi:hypothetical protein